MKKTICALLALTMVLLCAGCGSGNNVNNNAGGSGVNDHGADGEASGNIYTDITGIAPDETLMEIDGSAIPAELYFYWLAYSCSSIEYQLLSAYNYYGAYGELVNEDNTIKWDADLTDGVTVGQFALLQAEDTLRFYAAIEAIADEQGVTLTEEDEAAIEASHEAAVEDLGSEEAFEEYLYQLGITQETFDRIATISHLFDRLTDLVLQEGSPLYLEEADYDQYGVYADHILLSTVDTATGEALPEEEAAAKLETANDLLAQLRAAEDPEALFAQLADTYSEDPGRETNPTGYIYTPGTMVQVFEDTAAALAPGEISDVVQSDYGYHIILRKDLAQGLADYPDQKRALAEEHLQSILQLKMDQAEVTQSEKLDGFDLGAFYADYVACIESLLPTADSGDTAADTASNSASNNTAANTADNTADSAADNGEESGQ